MSINPEIARLTIVGQATSSVKCRTPRNDSSMWGSRLASPDGLAGEALTALIHNIKGQIFTCPSDKSSQILTMQVFLLQQGYPPRPDEITC